MTKLTTVICNYITREKLARVLESLQNTSGDLAHEVIVVDNHSKDDSAAMVREQFHTVRLIESGANLWFSGGNNLGMRAAQGEYVLILNPDTVILPNALQTMVAYLDANTQVGAVCSQMIFEDGTLQRNCSRIATYLDLLLGYTFLGILLAPLRDRRRQVMWYSDWDRRSNRSVEVAPDSDLMVRRSILETINYFDEKLKLYFTEDDICYRIIQTGHEVHYVADTCIIHDEHASVSQVQRLATQVYFNDLITYTQKYYGTFRALLLNVLIWPTRTAMLLKLRWKRSK